MPRPKRKGSAERGGVGDEGDPNDLDEDLTLRAKWKPPERAVLKGTLRGRNLNTKDFDLGPALGKGSFATARRAQLREMEEASRPPVVLKIMSKMRLLETNQVDHVKVEKSIMAELDSRFVVMLLSTFQDDRRVFLVLEYVHAGDLYKRLHSEGCLEVAHAKFYAAELLAAFVDLLERNIAYRDLKPENVLIDWKGHIKLCDFGFAKVIRVGEKSRTILGTPEYLAPETLLAHGHDHMVDYWALGVLIFEMLVGEPPFIDKSPFKIYQKVLHSTPRYPRHMDVKAADLVRKLLEHDPEKRFGFAECMQHLWFDFVPWEAVRSQAFVAPWLPLLESPLDSRYFDIVPDSEASDKFEDVRPITLTSNKRFAGVF